MISVLTIVFNLVLTGFFVIWVEKLTKSAYKQEMDCQKEMLHP